MNRRIGRKGCTRETATPLHCRAQYAMNICSRHWLKHRQKITVNTRALVCKTKTCEDLSKVQTRAKLPSATSTSVTVILGTHRRVRQCVGWDAKNLGGRRAETGQLLQRKKTEKILDEHICCRILNWCEVDEGAKNNEVWETYPACSSPQMTQAAHNGSPSRPWWEHKLAQIRLMQ